MTSLRKQLLVSLVPVFVVAALCSAVCVYFVSGYMVRSFMDSQLRVLADSHAGPTGQVPALQPRSGHNVAKDDLIMQIWDRNGHLLTSSRPGLAVPLQVENGLHDVTVGKQHWRVYTLRTPERTLQSIQNQEFREHVIRSETLQAVVPIVLLLPICAIVLWLAICVALRRLELVAKAATAQDERTLGQLPIEHVPTEIRPLVESVNSLLARLRDAFASQRRFVQDAAHELRTPITAMSLQLENLRACPLDMETAREVEQFETGLTRTKRLVEQLLRMARQEGPHKPDATATLDLAEFLGAIVTDLMPLADHRSVDVGLAASMTAQVKVNRDELCSLLHNLLDNALRYTPEGGVVDITLHDDAGAVTVEVVDNGPGIPEELLPRVFDRFFRIEGTQTAGSGLGLAIAKHAAERNQIRLELCNRQDCSGLIARLTFAAATVVTRGSAPMSQAMRIAAIG